MSDPNIEHYREHILQAMTQTQGNVALVEAGQFRKLGCIDTDVQRVHPTDLTVAGVLAYWEANGRGGARKVLENWADNGLRNKVLEFHWPCGQLLLELGIDTWAGQKKFASGLVGIVNNFSSAGFRGLVHKNIGTAGPYLK